MTIYVLKLQQGKYYVGRTAKPIEERYEEHCRGLGSSWTRKYPPVSIYDQINTSDAYQEDTETLKCMKKYGIENVRGGPYSKVLLTNEEHNSITQRIRSSNDQCQRCGRKGHFVKDCYATTDAHGSTIIDGSDDDHGGDDLKCFRCGRTGHLVSSCYANTHADGSKFNGHGKNYSNNAYERDDTEDSDDEEESDEEDDSDGSIPEFIGRSRLIYGLLGIILTHRYLHIRI